MRHPRSIDPGIACGTVFHGGGAAPALCKNPRVLCFGVFELDPHAYQLRRDGAPVKVEPQVIDVIAYLARHRDRVVPKEELLDEVWGDRFVSESALTSRIKSARQALGDDGRTQAVIRTAHGRGYQFLPLVTEADTTPVPDLRPGGVAGHDEPGAPTEPGHADLRTARAAVERAAWGEARKAFAAIGTEALDALDLERWAEASWWDSEIVECIAVRQDAFRRYCATGDDRSAARIALALADDYLHRGSTTVSDTWRERAAGLLAGVEDCRETGQLLRAQFVDLLEIRNDPDGALAVNERLRSLAASLGDADLLAQAAQDHGRVLLAQGRVDEGMAVIDRAMLDAATSATSPDTRGRLYCNMLSACVSLGHFKRAQDWSDEAITWTSGHASSPFPGICRIHRAGLRRRQGDLDGPVADLDAASNSEYSNIAGAALLELAEIHLLRGDVAAAEEALQRAHAYGADATAGFARVAVEQGRPVDAVELLRATVDARANDRITQRNLLPALVDAASVAGDLATARDAADRLTALCEGGSEACRATAERALGTVALLEHRDPDATEAMRHAVSLFTAATLPFEVATARLGLAAAARSAGAVPSARLERDAALAAYRAAGAVPTGTARLWVEQTSDLG